MRPLAVMGDVGEHGGAVPPSAVGAVGTGPAQAGVGTPQQPTDAAQAAPVGVPSSTSVAPSTTTGPAPSAQATVGKTEGQAVATATEVLTL